MQETLTGLHAVFHSMCCAGTALQNAVDLLMCTSYLPGISRHPVAEERRHAYLGFSTMILLIATTWKDTSPVFALVNLLLKRLCLCPPWKEEENIPEHCLGHLELHNDNDMRYIKYWFVLCIWVEVGI